MSKHITNSNEPLVVEIRQMIEDARQAVSHTVNAGLTLLYWNIGKRINEEILKNKRAEYGEKILPTVSAKLIEDLFLLCNKISLLPPKEKSPQTQCL